MTENSKEDVIALNQIPDICYLIWFKKNRVLALINFDSKVNTITLGYILQLGFNIRLSTLKYKKLTPLSSKHLK